MAEVIRNVERALREKGVPTGKVIHTYQLPLGITKEALELHYETGELVVESSPETIQDNLEVHLKKGDGFSLHIGDEDAIHVSLSKNEYSIDAPYEFWKKYQKPIHEAMEDLGMKCTNTHPLIKKK